MLARLIVPVPFIMLVPEGITFAEVSYDDHGYRVVPRPPVRADVPIVGTAPEEIDFEGVPGFAANALQIDFFKADFDRRVDSTVEDPPIDVMSRAVDRLTKRLRSVTRQPHIPPLTLPEATWRIEYFHDDGSKLPSDPDMTPARGTVAGRIIVAAVSSEVWTHMWSLPIEWTPAVWDDLLLDANSALPKIGPAIVLAATALEVFIAEILDMVVSPNHISGEMWLWINKRRHHEQEPSTEEQFDSLLKILLGHSLKENSDLWGAFRNLRTARNRFVHEGLATLGGRRTAVTQDDALRLIIKANEIIALVRTWVPAEMRWPSFDTKSRVTAKFNLL